MRKIEFGYEYKMYGVIEIEIPDLITDEQAKEYVKDNIEEFPLPKDSSLINGSCVVDEESFNFNV